MPFCVTSGRARAGNAGEGTALRAVVPARQHRDQHFAGRLAQHVDPWIERPVHNERAADFVPVLAMQIAAAGDAHIVAA